MRTNLFVVTGLGVVAGGLTLALAVPTSAWFAWLGDESLTAGVIAAGRVLVLGTPQYVGFGAALAGLLILAGSGGYRMGRLSAAS
ncbi:hypothetical protein [Georgenia yuyongxinii]